MIEKITFFKKVPTRVSKKKDVPVTFVLPQEINHSNLFDKNRAQDNLKNPMLNMQKVQMQVGISQIYYELTSSQIIFRDYERLRIVTC